MEKSRIFIASSSRALVLAEQLREQVRSDYCDGVLWTDESRGKESATIIEMLESATRHYDFAVVVLTEDDVMKAPGGDVSKARDNCIFEAGLFMAAIGRKRCFIVSSVNPKDLPTDLGGVLFLPFKEPGQLKDPDQCKDAVMAASTAIKTNAYRAGPVKRPLPPELLLEKEKLKYEGGDLYEGQVVVASTQPLALGYEAARQVRKNIDGNVRYIYIFPGTSDGVERIPQLLQLVLLVGISCDAEQAADFARARDTVRANQEPIVEGLKQICRNESMKIYFVPPPHDVQYCIHNATDDRNATLYVRHKDGFIEWESGSEAYHTSHAVRTKHGVADPQPPNAIFYSALGFQLREAGFIRRLSREVARYFPGIEEKVMKLCLDGPDE
jgi:hypothetical protein